jgi:hypothetical protein
LIAAEDEHVGMVLLTGSIVASYSFGDNPNPNPTGMSKK